MILTVILILNNLNFNNSFSNIFPFKHFHKGLEHIVETFCYSFLNLQFSFLNPLLVLTYSFHPSVGPSGHNETLHLELIEKNRELNWGN